MKSILSIALLLLSQFAVAETAPPRYADAVAAIKRYDRMYQTPPHPIVFVGSSSIRKWETLQVAFGSYNVINRGIGGSTIEDIAVHLDDLVVSYQPRQVVLYVGDNNIPDEKESATSVAGKTVDLVRAIRARLPGVPLLYISMKPSPSRDKYRDKYVEANRLIADALAKEPQASFVDVFAPMLDNGKARRELFVDDMLHLNRDGYRLWEEQVGPHLLKN
ncbi:lysophospholipase L1-like esterase [Pseudoduganella lurida]|uniref:Lysophospholipase L1-like esterase n=1 Tax=Pseudoduganella lurida TaxID=1036180 RepID=A0A562R2D3_9BURK|nr:GDSL-type esterase/lipase family protein [Pseudoduganella lurida]TWI62620.1 lysophospholipase L1-like esterase [Pseudoduganella lurida]